MGAILEQVAALHETEPDWYRAWCNRVLLRDTSPMGINDVFVSALAFAAEPLATVDPAVLDRDLRTPPRLAADAEQARVLLVLDDADALLEDSVLVERLLALLTRAGFGLLMSARFTGLGRLCGCCLAVPAHLRDRADPSVLGPGDAMNACLVGAPGGRRGRAAVRTEEN